MERSRKRNVRDATSMLSYGGIVQLESKGLIANKKHEREGDIRRNILLTSRSLGTAKAMSNSPVFFSSVSPPSACIFGHCSS